MRSKEEIEKKIKESKAERKKLTKYSMFGEPNWLIVDKRIATLKKCINLDAGAIRARLKKESDQLWGIQDCFGVEIAATYNWVLGNIDEL